MISDDLLTVSDVAVRLKVGEETVREWLRTDQLRGYNFGGRTGWRIPVHEVEQLLSRKSAKRRRQARDD